MPDDDQLAIATDQDDLIEETPTAYPTDEPVAHDDDPDYVPAPGFDEGLEVTS